MIEIVLSLLRNIKHIGLNLKYIFFSLSNPFSTSQILNESSSVNLIIDKHLSVSRFGDGEFRWMSGVKNEGFQVDDAVMRSRLSEILSNPISGHISGLPYNLKTQRGYTTVNSLAWKKLLINYGKMWSSYVKSDEVYIDSNFSRPYIDRTDKGNAAKRFEQIKKIWKNKTVLIVEGENTRFGVKNDLLDSCKGVKRIICPSTNAFSKYNEIFSSIMKVSNEFDLILLALGPTATVLAYDIAKYSKVQAIDIGHIDLEYEWFKLGTKRRVMVANKYVNELGDTPENHLNDRVDFLYKQQVIFSID